jgi:two-component system nitrogen regulation response regulator NtrX
LFVGCPTAERLEAGKSLAAAGLSVDWADSLGAEGAELQRIETPVLVDLSIGAAALQHVRDLRAAVAPAVVFALVDPKRPDLTMEAVLAGVADVFARPICGRRVAAAIEREVGGTTSIHAGPDDLYGHSPAMREVMKLIARASTVRSGVLIQGEEGTGRQVAARAIHASQNGGTNGFVAIDCAEHDSEDFDALLFGAPQSSAGRGAGLERIGRRSALHDARNGTLYLRNVAELPTRVQARLARVLRDREVVLAEDGESIDFDVRPMAGVDPGFDGAVEEGRVRDDLYKRLSAIRIDMPPLRNRREDIPAIANFTLREICSRQRLPPKTLSRPALALIAALPWRGNASELRALLESIVEGLQGGRNIGLEDVLQYVRLDSGSVVFQSGGTLKQARAKFEREYIAAVLDQHHGRISDAARALGIQRTNLYRKIRSLRIKKASKP